MNFAVRTPLQDTAAVYRVDRLIARRGGPLGAYISFVGHRGKDNWRADADLSSFNALITGAPFKIKGRISGLGARMAFAGSTAFDSRHPSDLSGIGEVADIQRLWSRRRRSKADAG